jgi:hypothetical protein
VSRPYSNGLGVAFDARAALLSAGHRGKPANTEESFWARVTKGGPDECWPFDGRTGDSGHGSISWGGPERPTHRVAWSLVNGAIPARMVVRHRCDNPTCCNPAHLQLGTIADNNRDARERGQARGDQLVRRGESNARAKLTDATVRELRAAWRAGESIKSIVARTGLATGTIHPMLHGHTWRHVSGEALAGKAADQ